MARIGLSLFLIALIGVAIWTGRFAIRLRQSRIVVIDSSEGFVDLSLPVRSYRCGPNGNCTVDVRGSYEGKEIGLKVVFTPNMKENRFQDLSGEGKLSAQQNGICLQFTGDTGKNFVSLLSSLYEIHVAAVSPPANVCVTAVPLEGDPQHIGSSTIKFKTFHHDDDPEAPDYFELFIDPDLPNGIVRFNEKDVGYRSGILRALGAAIR